MQLKSEKLKKLEAELADLERWLELGLVPKKDQAKHENEIASVRAKLQEEQDRLKFLKEHGDLEEYVAPKRQTGKPVYQAEMPTIPDVDFGGEAQTAGFEGSNQQGGNATATGNTTVSDDDTQADQTESGETTNAGEKDEDATARDDDEDEESYFSDRARWRRGGIIDPEADDW